MIFKFTKITDATNTIVGPTNTNGGKVYSIDSMFSLEIFDDSFLYPDSYDIKVQLDSASYSCDVLVRASIIEDPTYNE